MIIYGPPAVGKLTTAKILAKLTGYKLFHNHLTVDLVGSLFAFGSPPFSKHIRFIRNYLFEQAAKNNVDMIFTFVYAAGEDDEVLNGFIEIIERNGGMVCLVQLTASIAELRKRVGSADRKRYSKMSKTDSLEKWLKQYKLFSSLPGRKSLVLDTTQLSPKNAARKIVEHFNLVPSQS